jgi:hypothetical protein
MGSIETRPTDQLIALRDKYEDAGNWPLAERCEAELERRDDDAEACPWGPFQPDSPSLEDMGQQLGSYAT